MISGFGSNCMYVVRRISLAGAIVLSLSACEPANGGSSNTSASVKANEAPHFGRWDVTVQTDPMTDKKVVRINLLANEGNVTLSVACTKENAWVQIHWGQFLGGEQITIADSVEGKQFEEKAVTYRVGDGKAVNDYMIVLGNRTSTQVSRTEAFIEQVRAADKLALQTQPYNENPLTVAFETKGLTEALNANRPECDWFVRDIIRAEFSEKRKLLEGREKHKSASHNTLSPQKSFSMPTEDALAK